MFRDSVPERKEFTPWGRMREGGVAFHFSRAMANLAMYGREAAGDHALDDHSAME